MLTRTALNHIHIRHSTRFPTLCTLTVDRQAFTTEGFPPSSNASPYEWRLPTNDPRDEGNDLHRLHTLDIYFWTLDDANLFLDSVGRVLSQKHIETDRYTSDNAMSSVVRQLEDVAVTDPAYQNGQTRNSRTEPAITTAPPESQNVPATGIFPPPPPGAPPSDTATPSSQPAEQKDAANFTPLPYNPAAPAAPEPIQHREKTPPPVDGAGGTGLAAAAAADSGAGIGVPYGHQAQAPMPGGTNFGPPPTQAYSTPGPMPGSYASPPPSAGLPQSGSFSSHSTSIQTPPGGPYQSHFPPNTSGVPQPATTTTTTTMSFAPPPTDPNAHLYTQAQPQTQTMYPPQNMHPQLHHSQTMPIGGFSTYSYETTAQPQAHPHPHPYRQGSTGDYEIHSQVYRPTEAEAGSHYQKYAQQAMKNGGQGQQRPRKLEDGAARVENSVNRFLKKLEKKSF